MRILIITDSLGLPRREISYEQVWTDKLLNKCQEKNIIAYTMLRRSLTIKELFTERDKISIGYLRPDLIIFQLGIVDASRRVLPLWTEHLLSSIPMSTNRIRHFLSEHHYNATRLYNCHYNSPNKFAAYLKLFVEWLEERPRSYAFIKIAPPGNVLCSKTFNIENDVSLYNNILLNTVKDFAPHGTVLDPYKGHTTEEFILEEDGHHLNPIGEQLVFDTVYDWIQQF